MVFTRGDHKFYFEGLVVENLDVDILAGIPFMERNDIAIRPSKREVFVGSDAIFTYGSVENPSELRHSIRRAHVLRAPTHATTVWPGEFLEVDIPSDVYSADEIVAIEPRVSISNDKSVKTSHTWPPATLIPIVCGKIRIPNLTEEPQGMNIFVRLEIQRFQN